jgi:trans-aconitate methyltransferase
MGEFEFDGEKYKQASRHQKEWGNQLISEIDLKGNECILDLGCGDGALSKQLAAMVPEGKVIGIDASVGMIQTAKELEKSNVSFLCMDINDLSYENEFDLIFSNAALHWVKNHRRLLQNSIRALKPNGRLAWNFAGDGTCAAFLETIGKVMDMPFYQEFFRAFESPWYMPKKDDYVGFVGEIGFRQFEVSYENKDRYFSNSDEMIRWIDQPTIGPFLARVPEDKKEGFRNAVVEMMIEKTKQEDGRYFETFRRISVKAVKSGRAEKE